MNCSKCNIIITDETKPKKGRMCKICVSEWHRNHYKKPEVKIRYNKNNTEWRTKNRELSRLYDFKHRLKGYGITLNDYERMFMEQSGKCAICKSSSPKRKDAKKLFIDHDHSNGKVRGLLCHRCNLAVGWMEDDPIRESSIIDYLNKNK